MEQKTMGAFISALRKANGMTQQELADRLNVSNKAVSRWERDETSPDLGLIPAIAEIFGITCDELLKGERILAEPEPSKSNPKVDRQLISLVNRKISWFKTLIFIAMALSMIGLVSMIGIPLTLDATKDPIYGAFQNSKSFANIGLAAMFLFEISGITLTVIAISRMIDTRQNNELFQCPDQKSIQRYNAVLFRYSYATLWVIYGVTLIGFWYWCLWTDQWFLPDYLFHLLTLALLLMPALFPRKWYRRWVTGSPRRPLHLRSESIMSLLQLLFLVLSAVCFYASSSVRLYENLKWFYLLSALGWGFLVCVAATFLFFLFGSGKEKKPLLLKGIRNLCLCLSVVFFHRSRYIKLYTSPFNGSIVPNQEENLTMLWLAIGSAVVIVALSLLWRHWLRKKNP